MLGFQIFGWFNFAFGIMAILGSVIEPQDAWGVIGGGLFAASGFCIAYLARRCEGKA